MTAWHQSQLQISTESQRCWYSGQNLHKGFVPLSTAGLSSQSVTCVMAGGLLKEAWHAYVYTRSKGMLLVIRGPMGPVQGVIGSL